MNKTELIAEVTKQSGKEYGKDWAIQLGTLSPYEFEQDSPIEDRLMELNVEGFKVWKQLPDGTYKAIVVNHYSEEGYLDYIVNFLSWT